MEENTEEVIKNEGEETEEVKNVEEVELVTNGNGLIIEQVCEALEDNNIPYVKKDEGSGAVMGIAMGFSYFDKTVLVSKEDYDRAKEIIEPILSSKEEEGIPEEDLPEELRYAEDDEEDEDEEYNPVNSTVAHEMFWMYLGFLFISFTALIFLIMALR